MGLYYNPPFAYIGGNAPLAPERIAPPISGPAPTPPPLVGATIPPAIDSWTAAAIAAIPVWLGASQPFEPRKRTPPAIVISGPPVVGMQIPAAYASWSAAAAGAIPVWLGARQPFEKLKVTPPSGPLPTNPPIIGASAPLAALNWRTEQWRPDPVFLGNAQPYAPIALDPPISGPLPTNPPFAGTSAPLATTNWRTEQWRPDPVFLGNAQPYAPTALDPPISGPLPTNPPIIGMRAPLAATNWRTEQWCPDPVFLGSKQPNQGLQLSPPISGPPPVTPPPFIGATAPLATLNWRTEQWRPDPVFLGNKQPYQQRQLSPPLSGPPPQRPPVVGPPVPPLAATHWRTEQWRPDPVFLGTAGPYLPIRAVPPVGSSTALVLQLFSTPLQLSGQFMGITGVTVSSNGRIVMNDYNNLVVEAIRVYGTGNNNVGYGQSAVTLAQTAYNSTDTAAQWTTLRTAVVTCSNHQGTNISGMPSYAQNARILASDLSNMQNFVYALNPNRLLTNGGASMTLTSTAYSNTRATSWGAGVATNITSTFNVDFGSEDAARFFFNSGGKITLRFSQPGATPQDLAWSAFFANNVGNISMLQDTVTQTGASSPLGSLNTRGFYQIDDTARTMFNATFSAGAYSANSMIIKYQRRNFVGVNGGNGTGIQFSVTLADTHTGLSDSVDSGTTVTVDYLKATVVLSGIVSPTITTVTGF